MLIGTSSKFKGVCCRTSSNTVYIFIWNQIKILVNVVIIASNSLHKGCSILVNEITYVRPPHKHVYRVKLFQHLLILETQHTSYIIVAFFFHQICPSISRYQRTIRIYHVVCVMRFYIDYETYSLLQVPNGTSFERRFFGHIYGWDAPPLTQEATRGE